MKSDIEFALIVVVIAFSLFFLIFKVLPSINLWFEKLAANQLLSEKHKTHIRDAEAWKKSVESSSNLSVEENAKICQLRLDIVEAVSLCEMRKIEETYKIIDAFFKKNPEIDIVQSKILEEIDQLIKKP